MKEVAELKAKLAAVPEAPPPPAAAPEVVTRAEPDNEEENRAKMLEERRTAMRANLATKMERLTEKLALNPEQAAGAVAWHEAWMEKELAASMKSPRDPADYHLRMAYRQDLSPEVQATLTPEQRAVWEKYDSDKRADSVESITNGEMGFIAGTLDLSRDQKDQLFPLLSQLYLDDTYADFANVVDVPTLSQQKDADNERRRQFYSTVFTPEQMEKWEAIAVDYKASMLKSFEAPAK